MAYEEQTYQRQPTLASDETDPAAYRRSSSPAADYRGRRRDTGEFPRPGIRAADDVSDGPRWSNDFAGEPGPDRIGVHVGWEIILVLAVGGMGFLLYQLDPATLRGPALDTLLLSGTVIGLLTMGAGLTLRAGVPNLAVGPIALAAALHFAENGDKGLVDALWPALAIAAVGGLVAALLVVAFHVPGWAVTLGAAMAVIVYNQLRTVPVDVQSTFDPSRQAFFYFGGFALISVLAGAIGTTPAVRRSLGRMRPVADPASRRGPAVILPVAGSLVVSSVFAVLAGVIMAAQSAGPIVPGTGLEWTGLAVGLALVAGTSAYGRRGGIFGTLLAVAGMTMFITYQQRRDFDIAMFAIAAGTIAAGLIITRLVETYGQRLPVPGFGEDWQPATMTTANWTPDSPQPWSPASPAAERVDRWGAGRP